MWGIWAQHSWVLWRRVSHKVTVKGSAGTAAITEILFQAHIVVGRIQFLKDCGTKGLTPMLAVDLKPPSVPYHVGLSLGQLTTWQLASSGKKSKSEREWEWVQLLVKIGCVVFRPEHRPLQRLLPSGPQRESRPPYTRLGDNQHIAASEESCSQGQGLLGIMLFCTLMSKAQRFPRSLYLRLWAKFIFRCLCWGLLMKEGGRNLEDTFPLSQSILFYS